MILLGAVLAVAGCGGQEPAAPSPESPSAGAGGAPAMNPAAIERVRSDLPPGYEVAEVADHAAPAAFWGFKPDWVADPAPCGVLADPGGGAPTHGWSASGAGGIIHAVVAGPGVNLALPSGCEHWTLTGGRATAAVTASAPPTLGDTPTAAMRTEATTTVEGGTETRSHADTAVAFLHAGYVVYVTVVTDPGSALPVLGPDTAARLLAEAVREVSGQGGAAG